MKIKNKCASNKNDINISTAENVGNKMPNKKLQKEDYLICNVHEIVANIQLTISRKDRSFMS